MKYSFIAVIQPKISIEDTYFLEANFWFMSVSLQKIAVPTISDFLKYIQSLSERL